MSLTTIIKLLFLINSLIFISYGENSSNQECKPRGTTWEEGGTQYRSLHYRHEVYAYAICKIGFKTSSSTKVRCVNGVWENPLPRCERVTSDQCQPPLSTEIVIKKCDKGTPSVGSVCEYRCPSQYFLIGSRERVCGVNLQWSGLQPQCVLNGSKSSIDTLSSSTITAKNSSTSHSKNDWKSAENNSCEKNNGGCEDICDFGSGFVQCFCRSGYKLVNHKNCLDIDECQESRLCSHLCINTQGSYTCGCPPGYTLGTRYQCKAIEINPLPTFDYTRYSYNNERRKHTSDNAYEPRRCDVNNGGCEQMCLLSSNGYPVCSCRKGYTPLQGGKCQDIDECQKKSTHNCSYTCINTPGSYKCECRPGYVIRNEYYCEDIDECQFPHQYQCNQKCINTPGSYLCSCEPGYTFKNSYECEDIDECQFPHKHQCNQKCRNIPGSYVCSCEPGYILKNSYECEACRKNSYSSENHLNNICIECPPNSVTNSKAKSSITDCHCLPGFTGTPSLNIPCDDINECFTNNFGCSHSCINTPGSALCSCPVGFELKDDNKTCVDRNECQIKNGGCEMFCQNSVGGFNCSCSDGYTLAEDNYSCIDIDECADNYKGGCSDICNNFPGGYYCACLNGFRLAADGKTCLAARCLSVAVPHHSSLRCKAINEAKVISKPHDYSSQNPTDYSVGTICRVKCGKGFKITTFYETIECLEDGSWNATTPQCIASHCPSLRLPENGNVYPSICKEDFIPVQQRCYFTCDPGYEIDRGKRMIKCKNNVTWTEDPPSCQPVYIAPSITCPDDITEDLRWNENSSYVFIPPPITNMEIFEIYPDWIKLEQPIPFPSGNTNVLFKVRNFDTNMTSQCTMTISIIDKQPPIFITCPESFSVIDTGYQGVVVTWDEPIAVDNVAIQSTSKNLEPNSTLNTGIHYVEYTAKDAAGNSALCTFQIYVNRSRCKDLDDPENGKAICMDSLMGRLCRPACEPGYFRDSDEPKFFACGKSGQWTPTNAISPCLPNCLNETTWSTISKSCEEEAFTVQ